MSVNRIFIETSALTSGNMSGVGHTLLSILRAWQNDSILLKKFNVFLLVPFDRKKQVQSLGLQFPIKTIFIPDKLIRVLRRYNLMPCMDKIFGRGVYLFPNFWNWPLANSKSITYVYDVSFLAYPNFVEPMNQKFLTNHLAIWLKRTDKVITISNHAKREIIKYYRINKSKIEVIYNGVDSSLYRSVANSEISSVKKKYKINGNYILFVGNIEPRKNISRLILAYRNLPIHLRNKYSLVIVGSNGWNNASINADINRAISEGYSVNRIKGYVSDNDLVKIYAGATSLVHPALYEGFGMTPLESMAAGTPTIVGNNSSLPEVVKDAGMYFNAEDEQDMSNKIRILLENKNEQLRLIKAGKERVKMFTWEKTAQNLVRCFGEYEL